MIRMQFFRYRKCANSIIYDFSLFCIEYLFYFLSLTTLLFMAREGKEKKRFVKPLETVQVREQILVGGMLRTQLSSLFIAFQGGQDDHCWNPQQR